MRTLHGYHHHDHLGTPIQATDRSGIIVWSAQYNAFGNITITTPTATDDKPVIASSLRFPGQVEDAETGLYYNWHRYYDPELGRYVTGDPIGLDGGINFYAYVSGNPVNAVDPLGLQTSSSNGGLFPDPNACSYYEKQCKKSCGEDKYACEAKKCCESFGDNFFSNCTRKCLIDQDTWACAKLSGTARDSCRKRAHYFCYSACFNAPDAIGGGFGTLPPPACKGAADAIGGMW